MSNIMQFYQSEFNKIWELYQKHSLHSALLVSGAEASYLDVFCRELACKILGEDANKDFCPDLKIIKYYLIKLYPNLPEVDAITNAPKVRMFPIVK